MSQGPFGLEDEGFWTAPLTDADSVMDARCASGLMGIAIDAPAVAALDRHDTVPLIGCTLLTLREEMSLRFKDTSIVVAVREEDGAVLASVTQRPGRRTLGSFDPPEPVDPGEGRSFGTFELDLRERLFLPATRASYLVTVLARDRVSNRVRILVQPPSGAKEDPAALALARRRLEAGPPSPFPAPSADRDLPSYARRAESPPLPDGPGIALAVDRVFLMEGDAPLVLRGSFRLPVREHERIARPIFGEPTAVVPITLVLAGADDPGPFVLPLSVESHAPIDENGLTTGWFALDLLALRGMPRIAQTYFAYAFAGEVLSSPVPVAIVTQNMIELG